MRGIPKVRIYCEAIFIVSLAAFAPLIGGLHLRYVVTQRNNDGEWLARQNVTGSYGFTP